MALDKYFKNKICNGKGVPGIMYLQKNLWFISCENDIKMDNGTT